MAVKKFSGIFPPLPTPFDHAGNFYPAKLRYNLDKWNRVNLGGYVVGAPAGEGVYLSEAEKLTLWAEAAQHTASGRLLIAATTAESVRETLHLTREAARLGYHAALVSAPLHYPAVASIPLYFQTVADSSPIPLLITGLSPETAIPLTQHPNISGVLDASGDLAQVQSLLSAAPTSFAVLNGAPSLLAASLQAGASGAILDYAAAAPFSCLTILEAVMKREYDAAQDWQLRINPAATLVNSRYGVPGLKYALDFNGFYGGPPRLPLLPLPRAAQLEIEAAFENLRG